MRKEKHIEENIGNEVEIKLFKMQDKQKNFIGNLKEFDQDILKLECAGKTIEIERKNIAQIKTTYDWEN